MYSTLSNLVLGFHGCDVEVFEKILYRHEPLKISSNKYDWLGSGMYFWEQNLARAWEWAVEGAANPKINIRKPAVIGAVIDLGYCLNLLDSSNIQMLKEEYDSFKKEMDILGTPIVTNKNIKGNDDLLLRFLDNAVIEHLKKKKKNSNLKPFDSVRGVFIEGRPIYPTSGFMQKSHIQICIRNPNCIKGFFSPRELVTFE